MKIVRVSLNETLYRALVEQADECSEAEVVTPEMFATQCVESVLASRRLRQLTTPFVLAEGATA